MRDKRRMNIVSRGGSLLFAWMMMTGNENPFYEYYDEVLRYLTVTRNDACWYVEESKVSDEIRERLASAGALWYNITACLCRSSAGAGH